MILLIEDSFDVQTMLRDALAEAGYEVVAVANGNTGIEAQHSHSLSSVQDRAKMSPFPSNWARTRRTVICR